jgi:hypothetical protein
MQKVAHIWLISGNNSGWAFYCCMRTECNIFDVFLFPSQHVRVMLSLLLALLYSSVCSTRCFDSMWVPVDTLTSDCSLSCSCAISTGGECLIHVFQPVHAHGDALPTISTAREFSVPVSYPARICSRRYSSAISTEREFLIPVSRPAQVCSRWCSPLRSPQHVSFRPPCLVLLEFAHGDALILQSP